MSETDEPGVEPGSMAGRIVIVLIVIVVASLAFGVWATTEIVSLRTDVGAAEERQGEQAARVDELTAGVAEVVSRVSALLDALRTDLDALDARHEDTCRRLLDALDESLPLAFSSRCQA